MNKLYVAGCLLLSVLVSNQVQAASGFKAGLNVWSQSISGNVEYEGDRVNVESDFGIVEPSDSIKLYFETQDLLPFFPDFRVYYDTFEYDGKTTKIYQFGGTRYAEDAAVSIRSESLGLVAFYSRNFFNLIGTRLGVDIRKASFDVTVSGFDTSTKIDTAISYSGTKEIFPFIPLIYGQVFANVPVAGLYVYIEGQYTKLKSNSLLNYRAAVGLELFFGIQMEAGYRSLDYEVKNDKKATDIDLSIGGSFFELNYVF